MLKTINSLKNLLILIDMAEKVKVIGRSIFNRMIEFLAKF